MDIHFAKAESQDYGEIARLFPELGSGDPVPSREAWLKDMAPTTILIRVDGKTAGYAHFNLLKDTGYVRNVVVAPDFRGRALGKALMNELATRFRNGGAANWCLNVKPDNVAAIGLYRSVGLSREYSSTSFRLLWDTVEKFPGPVDPKAGLVHPDEDAVIEAAFALPSGQLAEARARSGRILLRHFEGARPVSLAVFSPSFPGAFPFRVTRTDLVRGLLEAMRAYAKPEFPYVGVVAENAPDLRQMLLQGGAEVRMEFDHYSGRL